MKVDGMSGYMREALVPISEDHSTLKDQILLIHE